ncbi:c-type cytochrome [Aliishimia ponticola]|uniref:C-type cytochrome n=1 Tax=Aliishimia ponticola TaxID=2499833 RepID=A0A4S4NAG4_9RHOB|nr:c-type cytochrome [Aliishimia ponticola]THH35427.1 c-type cytochrome [Aliishimia ponticola]
MIRTLTILAALSFTAPAFADGHASGDADAGEKAFKKCKSCHMIETDAGETIVKGGKTGPNLYGLFGRQPGSVEGYRYGDDLVKAGETIEGGWTEAEFISYVADPKGWLNDKLGGGAKSKMSFRLKKEEEAADVWAFIVSHGPAPE